jgi:3-methyladenine DNA glycosylase AlkD
MDLLAPTSSQLGTAAQALMDLPEREYHYAAYDLIERYRGSADSEFLRTYGTDLLTTTPWWDTVDGLVNAMVSPLMRAVLQHHTVPNSVAIREARRGLQSTATI